MASVADVSAQARHSIFDPAPHTLHRCTCAEEFILRFETLTGCSVRSIADGYVSSSAARAVFVVGSIPLEMATPGSDIDFLVIVESGAALLPQKGGGIINTDQRFGFTNESNPLLAGTFVRLMNGIAVEVQVAIAPSINRVHERLRQRGPELAESEIIILGRLSKGWLLWQSEGFLDRSRLLLQDPALDVYCSTKHFVSAEIYRRKARTVLDLQDIPLALHLGRLSIEMAFLAYFASEGYSYLGVKWLAQIGHAHGAAQRLIRHPLLKSGLPLLFPQLVSTTECVSGYLELVSEFLQSMRDLIEQKTLFRIAYHACPQIHDIRRGR